MLSICIINVLYFNALIKEDGSLTKNSDGSYVLVLLMLKIMLCCIKHGWKFNYI